MKDSDSISEDDTSQSSKGSTAILGIIKTKV